MACQLLFRSVLLTMVAGCLAPAAVAQDPAYTQAFFAPVYLNPAATGAGEYDLRISAAYRRQWWLIPSNFHSTAFSVDKFLPDVNSGVGLLVTNSSTGYITRNSFYGTFAYSVCDGTDAALNDGEPRWLWSGGLQAGVGQTRLDYSKLYFADQLHASGAIHPSVSAADPAVYNNRYYPDFAAGTYFQYRTANARWLAGFSAHHLNRPDESLTATTVSPLPVKWTGTLALGLINPAATWAFNFSAIGYKQGGHSRIQAGFEATHNDYSNISLGLYYGGSTRKGDVHTVAFTLSLNLFNEAGNRTRAGLAHDSQVGSQGYMRTGGSSELGFVWDYRTDESISKSFCKPRISSSICPPWRAE